LNDLIMKRFNNLKLHLAPMAGFTDKAMRQICSENGADITWSEMVSAEGLVHNPPLPTGRGSVSWRRDEGSFTRNKSLKLAESFSGEKNYIVQIFGSNIESMVSATKIVENKIHPKGININLGCPVPKAKKAGYGACQMGEIPSVVKIIKKIKQNTSLPISVKTRLGISNPKEILDFAPKLEKAGANELIVHARTLPGMFHQKPDWKIVKKLTTTLKIPIIYNGGIKSPEDAVFYAQKTGCLELMIGQAAIGNPWIFSQIKEYFQTGKYSFPNELEKKKTILRHAELVEKYFGEKGFVIFRAHLASYLKNIPDAGAWRARAVQIKNLNDVKEIIKEIHFN